jgi:glycosyltransferase involved in cell wall biosynthesis
MKIAFVYDAIYPFVVGGGEKRIYELAKRLSAQGEDVTVVGMKYWEGEDEISLDGIRLVGVCKAVPLYKRNGKRSFTEPLYFAWFVFLHLMKKSYNLIDCSNFPFLSCIACKLATIFKETKLVITWYEVWGKKYWKEYMGPIGVFGYLIEKSVSWLADNNIAISEFTRKRAVSILNMQEKTIVVIPNGISFQELQKGIASLKEDQIIYVGRLVQHKRVDILITAFKEIAYSYPTIRLLIIGKGPEETRLRDMAKEFLDNQRIQFRGFLEEADLRAEMKKSLLFVLPSEREGLGAVIFESMGLGVPVIALECELSAAKNIIENGFNGLLVRNAKEMARAINLFITDSNLYRAIVEGGTTTAKKLDWDDVILPAIKQYYLEVVSQRGAWV